MDSSFRIRVLMTMLMLGSLQMAVSQSYEVDKTSFSLSDEDEFSPVYYGDGLVFSSTQKPELQQDKRSANEMRDANIWFVSLENGSDPDSASIVWKELFTPFNDGPVTFSPDGLHIYYSRNLDVSRRTRDAFDSRNQLGLFSARWVDTAWLEITPFPYNSKKYSITTPALSANGERIYFASDMPGGYGGADLWYCDRSEEGWFPPVNLGPGINTKGNESYPFANEAGILYFASDGLGGLGKKDIYFSFERDGEWFKPVHLDAPINSKQDDFGLISDLNGKEGYFSSNRDKSDDIYHFITLIPEFYACDSLQKNYYCYQFTDESIVMVDSLPLSYQWMFSDGGQAMGLEVEHCFPGAGQFSVQLHIIDNNTGNTFFTQSSFEVEITDVEQAYISSPDAFLRNEEVLFDAKSTNLPGFEIAEYYWDLGDDTRLPSTATADPVVIPWISV